MDAATKEFKQAVAAKGPIGTIIDKLDDIRERKRAADQVVKDLEADYNELAESLLLRLQAEGMDKASGKKATASITKAVTGNIVDWDSFTKFVKKTGHFHLFQRRLSDPAIRELFESKGAIPGIEPFTKTKLNLRSI